METRAGKYGRFGVAILKRIVGTVSESERRGYLERFYVEYRHYSNLSKKVDEPVNEGCVRELDGLDELDVDSPEQLARWFKEGLHLKYQKNTSRNERKGFSDF